MQNFDKNLIITLGILFCIFYLFYISLIGKQKLRNFQIWNRWQLINKQGYILAFILSFSYAYDYILKTYLYQFFVDVTQKQITLDMFVAYGFEIITLILFLLNLKINSYINSIDNRKFSITQEATFKDFEVIPRDVKSIKHYAHYFNGITLERSPKDYSVQNVKLNIDLNDIQKYKIEQQEKSVEINKSKFYKKLIAYINSKATTFKFSEITKFDIDECNSMLDLKILIFRKFENLTQKGYFASISQLYQVATLDQTEFLSFLRDSQHRKFCSSSIKHASLFLQIGELK